MEVFGKSMIAEPTNVGFLSSFLNWEGAIPSHKCDKKCQNEHVCANIYRCKLTGITRICDKSCNQRILYDNHTSLCRVSGHFFPLTLVEEQAVRGVWRKHDGENSLDSCTFKRRRGDAQLHPSPFERSFTFTLKIFMCLVAGEELIILDFKNAILCGGPVGIALQTLFFLYGIRAHVTF